MDPRHFAGLAVPFIAAAVAVNVFPFTLGSHTEALSALHLPIAQWLVVGLAYVGGRWREGGGRMDFVRFSGELFIYYVLIALGGAYSVPEGAGVLEGGTIPYTPAALAKKKENYGRSLQLLESLAKQGNVGPRFAESDYKVVDPEIGLPITEMHLVDEIDIKEGGVLFIRYHLTAPFCPPIFAEDIGMNIRQLTSKLDGVKKVTVILHGHALAKEINQRVNPDYTPPPPSP